MLVLRFLLPIFFITSLYAQQPARIQVAVMNFDATGMEVSAGVALTDRFRTELMNTGRFDVMERSRMDEILKEQGFQQTGACNSDACVVQAGRILGVTHMIAGSVGKVGRIYTVSARIVDIETGRITLSKTEDCDCPVEKILTVSMRNIALKIADLSINTKKITPITDKCIDADGNIYRTVKIGDQVWMAENLRATHYLNGDAIPRVITDVAWNSQSKGAYCEYKNTSENGDTFGRLYNWFTVSDGRGIAPIGWHVPRADDWRTLVAHLGGNKLAGDKMKATGNIPALGFADRSTNISKFNALPGGRRNEKGGFTGWDQKAYFWLITAYDNTKAWYFVLSGGDPEVLKRTDDKQNGFSVRCVKD